MLSLIQEQKLSQFGVIATKVNSKLTLKCCICGKEVLIRVKALLKKDDNQVYCQEHRYQSPDFKNKVSTRVIKHWNDGVYNNDVERRRTDLNFKKEASQQSKKLWMSSKFREKIASNTNYDVISKQTSKAMVNMKELISKRSTEQWLSQEHRAKQTESRKLMWRRPEYRQKQIEVSRRNILLGKCHRKGIGKELITKKGGKFRTRSTYETKYVEILENDADVISFQYEPLYIEYECNNLKRNYIPDFIVKYVNRNELVEIKPIAFVNEIKNTSKLSAARQFCMVNNLSLVIITEKDLKIGRWRVKSE
jgi:hypothetical protein